MNTVCENCGGDGNEWFACEGAITEERAQNVPEPIDTTGLVSCTCCDKCRIKCHESWMEENANRKVNGK